MAFLPIIILGNLIGKPNTCYFLIPKIGMWTEGYSFKVIVIHTTATGEGAFVQNSYHLADGIGWFKKLVFIPHWLETLFGARISDGPDDAGDHIGLHTTWELKKNKTWGMKKSVFGDSRTTVPFCYAQSAEPGELWGYYDSPGDERLG